MNRVLNFFKVIAVSLYLLVVFVYLLFKGKLPSAGLRKAVLSLFLPKYSGNIGSYVHNEGYCWTGALPKRLCSDAESASRLRLFEDGRPLGPAHVAHDEIRLLGGGRFSHWDSQIYFSTSDNSDPGKNGRTYSVREI